MKKYIIVILLVVSALAHCSGLSFEELLSDFGSKTDGLRLSFVPISTAECLDVPDDAVGVMFHLEEEQHQRYYRFRQYKLCGYKDMDEVVYVEDGYLYSMRGECLTIVFLNAAEGEPFFFIVESLDGERVAAECLVPYPLIAYGKKQHATVCAKDPAAQLFLVEGHMFPSGEKVGLKLQGNAVVIDNSMIADQDGRVWAIVATDKPAAEGERLTATLAGEREAVKIMWSTGELFFDPARRRASVDNGGFLGFSFRPTKAG